MGARQTIRGDVVQADTPDWKPLLDVAAELVDDFMWMYEIRLQDGRRVHAYKHIDTRGYAHLGGTGEAFRYAGGSSYEPVDLAELLRRVVESPR